MKLQKHSYRYHMKAWGLGVLFVILVSGCGSSHKEDTNNRAASASSPSASVGRTSSPSVDKKEAAQSKISAYANIPKLNRDTTLAGIDADKNGVRDDIDRYIDEHFIDAKQHAAVIQSAKVLQKMILVDKTNMDEIRKIDLEDNKAVNCLFYVFELNKIPHELESLTTNTRIRLLEYLKFSKRLDGTVSSLPKGDPCE